MNASSGLAVGLDGERRPIAALSPAEVDTALRGALEAHALAWERQDDVALAAIDAVALPLDREYERRGGWSRVYGTRRGKVHRSTTCFSLKGAKAAWLPQYSGLATPELAAELGDRLCRFCYPDAADETVRVTRRG